jgi:hypothetical protein
MAFLETMSHFWNATEGVPYSVLRSAQFPDTLK